jgi:hypothetical protein
MKKSSILADKFSKKLAQVSQQPQVQPSKPTVLPLNPFRTEAIRFFGDLYQNNLGYLFPNIKPEQMVSDIKAGMVEDVDIKSVMQGYLKRIQEQIDYLAKYRQTAQLLITK